MSPPPVSPFLSHFFPPNEIFRERKRNNCETKKLKLKERSESKHNPPTLKLPCSCLVLMGFLGRTDWGSKREEGNDGGSIERGIDDVSSVIRFCSRESK